jgi:anti-anti-sigma factor
MEIRTRLEGDEMHVELEGRMDAAWSGTVGKTLQETLLVGCHSVILDLGKVSYVSSAGIRILMLLAKQLKSIGGRLQISDQSQQVREVLEMVGFHRLIDGPSAQTLPTAPAISPAIPKEQAWCWNELELQVYELANSASQHGTLIGDPLNAVTSRSLRMTAERLAIGLGSIGNEINPSRAGELLAVQGLAISLPGNDPGHPDWMVSEGDLVPDIRLHYGLSTEGPFRYLLRFGSQPENLPVGLSTLTEAVLARCETDLASFVIVAESASLVGAALQSPADALGEDWFAYPALRERMLFTAEPAHASETCLIVGLASRAPGGRLATFMRPACKDSNIHLHSHAAVVPYRPVRKGLIDLAATLETLMESQLLRGVLHLLNDEREGIGAGESHLRRGAIWCAPVSFDDRDSSLAEAHS